MSSCCSSNDCAVPPHAASDLCPSCGDKGAAVDPITLKALLTSDGLRKGVPPNPRYCANSGCSVVYFDNAAGVTFRETELTVTVHAKHPESEHVPVCYCFGHTPMTIRAEMTRMGSSSASKMITKEVKAGHCACELRNPKGACCLGEVAKAERRLANELAAVTA